MTSVENARVTPSFLFLQRQMRYRIGFCPQSRRGIAPSENPAQDAERGKGETTQTPGSQGAERTRTTEVTQTQRWFIRRRRMTRKAFTNIPSEERSRTCTIPTPGRHHGGTGTQRATVSGTDLWWPLPSILDDPSTGRGPPPVSGRNENVTKSSQISGFTQFQ